MIISSDELLFDVEIRLEREALFVISLQTRGKMRIER